MGKSPAFQLYASDFYMDTAGWTATEVGAYFRLLMHEWVSGALPNRVSSLARIAGVDPRNMQKMWSAVIAKKFTTDAAGMYINLRLEETRLEQDKYREIQAQKGKKSAEIRWKDHITAVTPRLQPDVLPKGNSSSSTSNIKNNIYTPEFLSFYKTYPKHVGKADAWKAWKKLNGNLPPLDDLISKINEFKNTEDWKKENGKYIPHPATWLNGKRWEDELKPEKKETW